MQIRKGIFSDLVDITKSHKPNECCCLLFNDNKTIVDVTEHAKSLSPGHFGEIDIKIVSQLIDQCGKPTSIFHSHPCEAFVSGTDLRYMIPTIKIWNCIWLIMSDTFELKAFTITPKHATRGQTIRPVELEVEFID